MGKVDTFVLDFFNTVDDIKHAFDDFYTSTSLSEPTDVNVLHDLQEALANVGVTNGKKLSSLTNYFLTKSPPNNLAL
jgi:type I restriction enzyme R subunit